MGYYLPSKISSQEIEEEFCIPKGWSEKYSGVHVRHYATYESNGFMGARAAENALKKSDIEAHQIDLLISAGATYDFPLPNQASIIKHEMHEGKTYDFGCLDIDTTCLSFVSALEFAAGILDGVNYKNILIVSSEISSKGLNPNNWETLTLFGDGAAAAVIQYDENATSYFIKGMQKTYTDGVFDTIIRGGGNQYFFKDHPFDPELHSFHMNGRNLLRLAKTHIPEFMELFFDKLPLQIEDVNVIIPHQASKMGVQMFKSMFSFKDGQVKETLKDHGNCIAASIPITLAKTIEEGGITRGDFCLLAGTSAGFSIGASLIRY